MPVDFSLLSIRYLLQVHNILILFKRDVHLYPMIPITPISKHSLKVHNQLKHHIMQHLARFFLLFVSIALVNINIFDKKMQLKN